MLRLFLAILPGAGLFKITMAKDPAVLFYTSDFLSGTAFFTKQQRGEYITLLCEQHQLWSIPESHMVEICGTQESPVFKKFIRDDDGTYYNQRMRDESVKRSKFCDARRKSIEKRYVRNTHVEHTKVRMENENENRNEIKKEIEIKDPEWISNFDVYVKMIEPEWDAMMNDWEFIEVLKEQNPKTFIRRSLQKAWETFWAEDTERKGWKNKVAAYKAAKREAVKEKNENFEFKINWRLTVQKTLSVSRVPVIGSMVDDEFEHIQRMKERRS